MAVDYDADIWTLECCSSVEYPVFELWREDISVTFLAVKGDENVIENFYEGMTDLDVMCDEGRQSHQVDAWSKGSARCYTNAASGGIKGEKMGDSTMICYGRTEGEWVILARAEFPTKDSESENEERKQEIVEILNSMKISAKAEVEGVEEKENLEAFYVFVSGIVKYSASANLSREEGEKESASARGPAAKEEVPLQYIKQYMVSDLLSDEALYPVFAPADSDDSDRGLDYHDHGIWFHAFGNNGGTRFYLYQYFDKVFMSRAEAWELGEYNQDVEVGEIQANGVDRYGMISAKEVINGQEHMVKNFFYLDVQGDAAGVLWNLELNEKGVDEETNLIIDELGQCYGIDLDGLKINGN